MRRWIPRRPGRGFTLIELLIVITVIAILALIVIPRMMRATRQARETTLKANLKLLRDAIGTFDLDCGVYPASLTDLVRARTDPPATGLDAAGHSAALTGTYRGPYLPLQGGVAGTGIPINPFVAGAGADINDPANHWTYTAGAVAAAVPASGTTLEGILFSDL